MPETLKVLLLAAFQGVAEFLPISSSAHIAIIGDLAGANGRITDIEVSLHIGTLVSLCLFYRRRLAELLLAPIAHIREIVLIIVACVPAIIAYLVFDDALDEAFATPSPKVIGPMLMATGIALVSLAFRRDDGARPMCFWRALAIGVAQALALIPGVSRLGATTVCARHLGVSRKDSIDFSFLISMPLVLGGALMPLAHAMSRGSEASASAMPLGLHLLAAVVSAAVGYAAISLLYRFLCGRRFWVVGIYCVLAAIAMLCA